MSDPDQAPRLCARAEALEECADHLDQEWTDDPLEREEGKALAARLRAQAVKVRRRYRHMIGVKG